MRGLPCRSRRTHPCRPEAFSGAVTPRPMASSAQVSLSATTYVRSSSVVCSPSRRPIRPGFASPDRGRTGRATSTMSDSLVARSKRWGVSGPEAARRYPGFSEHLHADIRHSGYAGDAKLQAWILKGTPLFYFADPRDSHSHVLDGFMQSLWSKPLGERYWSCVP